MQLKIEYIPIDELKPYERNNKKHQDFDIGEIAKSIEKYGMNDPIGIWKGNKIIEGHGRLEACKRLGIAEVPCIRLDHLTDEQRREYAIVHNKSSELAEYDFDNLKLELPDLDLGDFDLDFGLDLDDDEETEIVEDDVPEVDNEREPITKLGDIWQLGRHRLMCGDSTDKLTVEKLMCNNKADMVFTDPPYNVDYTGKTEENLKIQNDCFATDEECGEKLWLPAFENMRSVAKDCCSYYLCMPQGGTHMMMMMMMMKAGWQVKHELIWKKQSIVLNRADYNYQHEPILFGWNKAHKFYGKGKYHTTSVWEYNRPTKSKEHPTMKPIELICEALQNSSVKNNLIIDLFGGSGSTLIACEQLDRICYTMELDTKYCDVIIKRWETLTGEKAQKIN